jgi:hypothetical protein
LSLPRGRDYKTTQITRRPRIRSMSISITICVAILSGTFRHFPALSRTFPHFPDPFYPDSPTGKQLKITPRPIPRSANQLLSGAVRMLTGPWRHAARGLRDPGNSIVRDGVERRAGTLDHPEDALLEPWTLRTTGGFAYWSSREARQRHHVGRTRRPLRLPFCSRTRAKVPPSRRVRRGAGARLPGRQRSV